MTPGYLTGVLKETLQDYLLGSLFGLHLLRCLSSFCLHYVLLAGCVIYLSNIFAPFIRRCRSKKMISAEGKAVFISGCDSGFGHGIAQVLDDAGYQVFAGCLFPEGDGAVKLRKSTSSRLHIIELDVTKDDSVSNAAAYVKEHLNENKLWAVVNNAGVLVVSELHWTDTDTLKRVIEVNTIGLVRVTKAFLSMLMESEGRVITVSSRAGRYTYPGLVAYCMSKHAAISFSDGLRLDMYKFGVKVVTIEPWLYKTSITDNENIKKSTTETWNKAPETVRKFYPPDYIQKYAKIAVQMMNYSISDNPSEVVDCIAEAVMTEHPRYSYSPGTMYSRVFTWFIHRAAKPLADFLILNGVKN